MACSEEDESLGAGEWLDIPAACGGYEHELCDILEATCQTRIAEIAACQWGGPSTPVLLPAVTTISEADLNAQLTTATAAGGSGDEARSAIDDVLTLFGLVQAGSLGLEASVERGSSGLLASYEFESKGITIVDRGAQTDLLVANRTLFHELIHAQQDAAHDLAAVQGSIRPNLDAYLAVLSLIEGEAEFHSNIFELGLRNLDLTPDGLHAALVQARSVVEDQVVLDGNAWVNASFFVPYFYGPIWIKDLWINGGFTRVQEQYQFVPPNMGQIARAAWDEQPEADLRVTDFPVANIFYVGTLPPEGSEVYPVRTDRYGPWTVYLMSRLYGDPRIAQELALGWRGDQIDFFSLDAGGVAGRWRFTFDNAAHAEQFAELLSGNAQIQTRTSGPAVVCVVTQGSNTPEWLFGPLQSF